jgi:hypothetical protein
MKIIFSATKLIFEQFSSTNLVRILYLSLKFYLIIYASVILEKNAFITHRTRNCRSHSRGIPSIDITKKVLLVFVCLTYLIFTARLLSSLSATCVLHMRRVFAPYSSDGKDGNLQRGLQTKPQIQDHQLVIALQRGSIDRGTPI